MADQLGQGQVVSDRILLTGASGYVGARLLPALEAAGLRVRCMARRPEYLQGRVAHGTEVVRGDVLDPSTLPAAFAGVQTAYYLVHAMGVRRGFVEEERRGAEAFALAARQAGVRRLIYLGGLGSEGELSDHLHSRQAVGQILRESGIATLEFRASVIIGSGSLSFEMIRALVDKLPVLITPRWVRSRAQPIGIEDVVAYLVAALQLEMPGSTVVEIGGRDQLSYAELMQEYARQRGLRRWILPVPVLTPWLSSLWLGLVTPLYARVGRKLIDSLRHDTVVRTDLADRLFSLRPRGVREAMARALTNEDREFAATRWSDALCSQGDLPSSGGVHFGRRLVDSRIREVECSAAAAFAPIERIGGGVGWYCADWIWRVRGFADLLFGGPGMRRGRRDPHHLAPGDTVDFWRVEAIEPGRVLRLSAQMKLPGRAWLQFEVERAEGGRSRIHQTALFDPRGLGGLVYWYALYPVHYLVFAGMLRGIARAARRRPDEFPQDG